MAVPGSVRNPASQGCRDLIRDQARLVTSARDILTEVRSEWLFRLVDTVGGPGPDGLAPDGPRFGDARDPVMDLLRTGSLTLDEVVAGVDAPGPEVVSAIARLRLDGHVRLRDGAYGVVGRARRSPLKGIGRPETESYSVSPCPQGSPGRRPRDLVTGPR